MNDLDPYRYNRDLISLVRTCGLTINEVLHRFNARQARPLAKRTLQTYLAGELARTRVPCPEAVLLRMKVVLKRTDRTEFR